MYLWIQIECICRPWLNVFVDRALKVLRVMYIVHPGPRRVRAPSLPPVPPEAGRPTVPPQLLLLLLLGSYCCCTPPPPVGWSPLAGGHRGLKPPEPPPECCCCRRTTCHLQPAGFVVTSEKCISLWSELYLCRWLQRFARCSVWLCEVGGWFAAGSCSLHTSAHQGEYKHTSPLSHFQTSTWSLIVTSWLLSKDALTYWCLSCDSCGVEQWWGWLESIQSERDLLIPRKVYFFRKWLCILGWGWRGWESWDALLGEDLDNNNVGDDVVQQAQKQSEILTPIMPVRLRSNKQRQEGKGRVSRGDLCLLCSFLFLSDLHTCPVWNFRNITSVQRAIPSHQNKAFLTCQENDNSENHFSHLSHRGSVFSHDNTTNMQPQVLLESLLTLFLNKTRSWDWMEASEGGECSMLVDNPIYLQKLTPYLPHRHHHHRNFFENKDLKNLMRMMMRMMMMMMMMMMILARMTTWPHFPSFLLSDTSSEPSVSRQNLHLEKIITFLRKSQPNCHPLR